jgi:hypothetical protein
MVKLKVLIIVTLASAFASAEAIPTKNCEESLQNQISKNLGFSADRPHLFHHDQSNREVSFKWNANDSWTKCKKVEVASYDRLQCGSVAQIDDRNFANDNFFSIYSTEGEGYRTILQGSKSMKCSLRPSPKYVNGTGWIYNYDYSAIYLFNIIARGAGSRSFFVREDVVGETIQKGAPKF